MEKYGFVYIWYDRKHKRFYIGCHWGTVDDGYVCSSSWMTQAYKHRPSDFKRKILKTSLSREEMYNEEFRWLQMIKPHEIKQKYYNLNIFKGRPWHLDPNENLTIGQKISKSKKGKSPNNDPQMLIERGKKISAKVKGRKFSPEHREKLRQAKLGKKHSPETIAKRTSALVETWNNGKRKRAEPKNAMTIEEQGRLHSENLKKRWADPVWAENQKQRLREGSKRRHQTVI